ncbi:A24 family peptidase [Atopobium sp. oral taxon 810]|uniref:prepilin peptidase n=1 Tax=Atopobium sp. oral taxon 810 TaxID=712158 RepID=UPI0003967FF3|nr:A24 family peptidase [Atopobium sp. oral taxon 810]ERI04332.1 peptidase, A24 family [Atopobium sp. oral taxon 810 str. F0209]
MTEPLAWVQMVVLALVLGFVMVRPLLFCARSLLTSAYRRSAVEAAEKIDALGGATFAMVTLRAVCSLLYLLLLWRYGFTGEAFELLVFVSALLVLTLTDLVAYYIPNESLLVAMFARLLYLLGEGLAGRVSFAVLATACLDAAIVAAPLLVLVLLMDLLLRRPSMGGGDLKLFALAGFYFGWQRCIPLVLIACILGIGFSFVWGMRKNKPVAVFLCSISPKPTADFPFGPAIAASCFVIALLGDEFLIWMMSFFS